MSFVDFAIIFSIVGLLIYLVAVVLISVRKRSKQNQSVIRNASAYVENSRLRFYSGNSVRLFHGLVVFKENIDQIRNNLPSLPWFFANINSKHTF